MIYKSIGLYVFVDRLLFKAKMQKTFERNKWMQFYLLCATNLCRRASSPSVCSIVSSINVLFLTIKNGIRVVQLLIDNNFVECCHCGSYVAIYFFLDSRKWVQWLTMWISFTKKKNQIDVGCDIRVFWIKYLGGPWSGTHLRTQELHVSKILACQILYDVGCDRIVTYTRKVENC